jgi:formate dehydrogenase subunit gamma
MTYPDWNETEAAEVLGALPGEPGPVLIALQAINRHFGYVPKAAVALIASTFNVSRADVHGVLTFYHDLRTEPAPKHCVEICVAEACQSVGSRELVASVSQSLGRSIDQHDSEVEVKSAFCFGNCALGPAVRVDGKLLGRATAASVSHALGQVHS